MGVRKLEKAAVIFDVGGVLIRPPQLTIAAYEREISLPRGFIGRAMVSGSPDNAFCRLERGELTLSQFIPVFECELHRTARESGVEVHSGFSAMELFKRITESHELCLEMMEAAQRVRESGLKTCVVTNNWIDDVFPTSHVVPQHLFDLILESSKLGLRKPDPEIYSLACAQLAVPPDQVVFLDDLGVNLKSAQQLGIATIKVSDPYTAVKELETVLRLTLTSKL